MNSEKSKPPYARRASLLYKTLQCLIPSYLHGLLLRTPYPTAPITSTTPLDGLRGLAALTILNFHVVWAYTQTVEFGYGSSPNNQWLHQLPILRLPFAAHAMVPLFFLISGYVNALSPLRAARKRDWTALNRSLASSLLRRPMRLYGPALSAMFITALTLQAGWWEGSARRYASDLVFVRYADAHPHAELSVRLQMASLVRWSFRLTDVWSYFNRTGFLLPWYPPYDPHLWTVPMEFRGGMVLALCLACVGRCRAGMRAVLVMAWVVYAAAWGRWEVVCFLVGALLAEVDMVTGVVAATVVKSEVVMPDSGIPATEPLLPLSSMDGSDPNVSETTMQATSSRPMRLRSRHLRPLAFLILALYFLSVPNLLETQTPGYQKITILLAPLASLTTSNDPKRFYHTLGSVFLILASTRCAPIRRFLCTTPLRVLGRISYAVYLVHGPLVHIVGFRVVGAAMEAFGAARSAKGQSTLVDSGLPWVMAIALGWMVVLGMTLLLADWFQRSVERCWASLGRWIERVCLVRDGP